MCVTVVELPKRYQTVMIGVWRLRFLLAKKKFHQGQNTYYVIIEGSIIGGAGGAFMAVTGPKTPTVT